MKLIFVICSLFTFTATHAQFSSNVYWTEQTSLPGSETIYYNVSRPLVWNDFKGRPETGSVAAAMTASGFGYKADFKSSGPKAQLNIGVYCYFSKTGSWVKPGRTTEYILAHEQQHFDISFIAAMLFMEKLKTANLDRTNYKVLLPKLYNECADAMNKMQNEYDGQTKNGQLKEMQAKWNAYVTGKVKAITK